MKTPHPDDELREILASALGSEIGALLLDPLITEVRRNSDGSLWINRLGQGRERLSGYLSDTEAKRVILTVSSSVGEICGDDKRAISAELPGSGARFQGVLPPLSQAPVFAIRKKALRIFPLDELISQGVVSDSGVDLLRESIRNRKNILIVGGTDSGKTTFANALLEEIAGRDERVVIIQDIEELQCRVRDVEYLRTKEGVATLRDLVRLTLRLSPDRIVIGEVRGAEALELLKAWNTGHSGGISTIHANSAELGISRLEQLIEEAGVKPSKEMIAEAVNVLVFLEKRGPRRIVTGISRVIGVSNGRYELQRVYE